MVCSTVVLEHLGQCQEIPASQFAWTHSRKINSLNVKRPKFKTLSKILEQKICDFSVKASILKETMLQWTSQKAKCIDCFAYNEMTVF